MTEDSYVRGLVDEHDGHTRAERVARAAEVLAELQRVAPDVATELAPKAPRETAVNRSPREKRPA